MENSLQSIEAASTELPGPLLEEFSNRWAQFLETKPEFPEGHDDVYTSLPKVWSTSEFVAQFCQRHPDKFFRLIESESLRLPATPERVRRRVTSDLENVTDEASLKRALRQARNREMVIIAWRDLAGWADLNEVMQATSALADTCLDRALNFLHQQACDKHGAPTAQDGAPLGLVVIGMGKLGGNELNFSSDIDLIFSYAEDGETGGTQPISHHEFFTRVGKRLIAVINETTENGFVFRVDMRLRPNGKSGPLALSFDAMEHYYQTHGREWERYAWIKARVVAGDTEHGQELMDHLRPFVFRRYLDFGAVESIREMKAMINQELRRKQIDDNIKLGPGGIREVEFVGQAFQLIRGGRDRPLQIRGIQSVLDLLGERGELTPTAVSELHQAYVFLRNVEHRLQMFRDQQTHLLPEQDIDRLRLAYGTGFSDWPELAAEIRKQMRKVHGHFEQVFVAPQGEATDTGEQGLNAIWRGALEGEVARGFLAETGFSDTDIVCSLLRGLREGAAYQSFSNIGRDRMDRLVPLLLGAAGLTPEPENTLKRLVRVLEAIGRRSAYLSLLVENPMAMSQLVKLCAASEWITNWISRHPIAMDELLHPTQLYRKQEKDDLAVELDRKLAPVDVDDLETQLEVLREFHHGHVLRTAAADVGPGLAAEEIGKQLCAIAEVIVQRCLKLASHTMIARHGWPDCEQARNKSDLDFIVIAYGKLGSLELGYTSDLDMIFLCGDCDPGGNTDGGKSVPNETFFARLGQRVIHLLTTRTPTGTLYEVDMRLRPSGKSGPLVISLSAFKRYQKEHAWVWEHQALVRARPVAGSPAIQDQFQAVRREILCWQRDPIELAEAVKEMRDKMLSSREPHAADVYDLKHDRGGIVDIEFMVQYWVLRWAHEHPGLTEYTDNCRLLEALAEARVLEQEQAKMLIEAYRHYLSAEYRQKLMELGTLVDPAGLNHYPEQVAHIWRDTFQSAKASS
jgi:glutamate-ammonia-ligase adenylyltransferase